MDTRSPRRLWPRRFSRRDVVVLVAIVCLLIGLAFPAIQMAREEARRIQCANYLLQIGLGLLNYHETYTQFPSAYIPDSQGQPRSSWRVAILPFVDSSPFYDQYSFDQPWNSPSNLDLAQHPSGYFYRCPSIPSERASTNYLAVTGAATAWPGPTATRLEDFSKPFRSILVVENVNAGDHWLEPRDLQFDGLDLTIHAPSRIRLRSRSPSPRQAISSEHPNGANVVFADGSLEFLDVNTPPEILKAMLVIGGSEPRVSLGTRDRVRRVFETVPPDGDYPPEWVPSRLESYTANDADEPNP